MERRTSGESTARNKNESGIRRARGKLDVCVCVITPSAERNKLGLLVAPEPGKHVGTATQGRLVLPHES